MSDISSDPGIKFIQTYATTIMSASNKEDAYLASKYDLVSSQKRLDEMNTREKFKSGYFHQFKSINRLTTLTGFVFTNYFNTKRSRLDPAAYSYSRYMQKQYILLFLNSCMNGLMFTGCLYLWMRFVKAKGSSDKKVMATVFLTLGIFNLNFNTSFFVAHTKLPTTPEDIKLRIGLLEKQLFMLENSLILTKEIKKISKNYMSELIEFDYVIPLTNVKVTFITNEGKLFLDCDNQSEVLGFAALNKGAMSLDSLNFNVFRERELIFGLFEFYLHLMKMYEERFGVKQLTLDKYEKEIVSELLGELTEEERKVVMKIEKFRDLKEESKIVREKQKKWWF